MPIQRTGDGWTVEIEDGVMVWEFLPGMELDDPFSGEVFGVWERSAARADQAGLGRWAVVADGIKAISLRGKIDTGGLETETFESRTDAVEWAKGA